MKRLFWERIEGIGAWVLEERDREGSKTKPRVCDKLVIAGGSPNFIGNPGAVS